MQIWINGEHASLAQLPQPADTRLICFLQKGHDSPQAIPGLADLLQLEAHAGNGTRFESHNGYDYMSLQVPCLTDPDVSDWNVDIFFAQNRLIFFHDDFPAIHCLLADLENRIADRQPTNPAPAANTLFHLPPPPGELLPEQVLYLFFAHLTEHDAEALDDMEETITGLEDAMTDAPPPPDTTTRVSQLRKRLLVLKRYYEALFNLLEDLEENWNGLFSKAQLRAFRIQTNRADRLNNAVHNLRDYVTQVRESYQNQLDIKLNQTMNLFTVITAIFLPLTLLAGWYGMNFNMPEYSQPWAYPVLIGVSILTVIVTIALFKRRKWF